MNTNHQPKLEGSLLAYFVSIICVILVLAAYQLNLIIAFGWESQDQPVLFYATLVFVFTTFIMGLLSIIAIVKRSVKAIKINKIYLWVGPAFFLIFVIPYSLISGEDVGGLIAFAILIFWVGPMVAWALLWSNYLKNSPKAKKYFNL